MKVATKTLKNTARTCAALLTAGLLSSTAFAQDAPANVPTSLLGTYNLTYANAQVGSPLVNGTPVQVIIGAGNTICLGGYTLTNPMLRNGNNHDAVWTEGSLGIEIILSSLTNGFTNISVGTTGGATLGQLQGSKVSNSTTGCGPDLTQINQLFAQAQAKLAQYFPPSANAQNQMLDGFIYRYYPSTSIYLAINNGEIYVMGGAFGDTPLPQGNIETILSELEKIDIDLPQEAEGDYRLVVTGDVSIMDGAFTFEAITIDNIAAPSASDIDGIREAVKESLDHIDFTGVIEVSEVNSAGSNFSFRIAFSGNANGVSTSYNLLYTYTKL